MPPASGQVECIKFCINFLRFVSTEVYTEIWNATLSLNMTSMTHLPIAHSMLYKILAKIEAYGFSIDSLIFMHSCLLEEGKE